MIVFLATGAAFAGSFYGTSESEFLYGTSENNFLSAGPGDDEIYGYEGDDIIYAADGTYSSSTDTIYCGEGNGFVVIDSDDLVAEDCEVYEFDWQFISNLSEQLACRAPTCDALQERSGGKDSPAPLLFINA